MVLVKLASVDEVKPNSMKGLKVNGKQILLANLNGSYYAIGNICTHMAVSYTHLTLPTILLV